MLTGGLGHVNLRSLDDPDAFTVHLTGSHVEQSVVLSEMSATNDWSLPDSAGGVATLNLAATPEVLINLAAWLACGNDLATATRQLAEMEHKALAALTMFAHEFDFTALQTACFNRVSAVVEEHIDDPHRLWLLFAGSATDVFSAQERCALSTAHAWAAAPAEWATLPVPWTAPGSAL
jgi:hypothetical protein